MKVLVVFYSRTGMTKKVAHAISKSLGSDLEELIDTKNRAGALGYLKSGQDATLKRLTKLQETKLDPAKYDLVIIGTPVWAATMSTPVRTYLHHNRDKLKKVAFFCTMGGSGDQKTLKHMENVSECQPLATLSLKTKQVAIDNFDQPLGEFLKKLK